MTTKLMIVMIFVLGMKVVHNFGLISGNLKLTNVFLRSSSQWIEIVDLILNQIEVCYQENCDTNIRMANALLSEFAGPEVRSDHKLT